MLSNARSRFACLAVLTFDAAGLVVWDGRVGKEADGPALAPA